MRSRYYLQRRLLAVILAAVGMLVPAGAGGDGSPPFHEVARWPTGLSSLHAVAAAAGGRVFVSGDRSLLCYQDGALISRWSLETPAQCLAVRENGELWLGTGDRVEVRSTGGRRLRVSERISGAPLLTSIAVTEQAVFVADAGNRQVLRYDGFARLRGKLGSPGHYRIPSPYFDLAVGHDGSLWVVNPGRHRLENYSADGRLRSLWGRPSWENDGFCGCCNPSHLALLPDGRFVTSEKGIPRVKIFTPDGRFQALVASPDQFAEGVAGLDLAVDSRGHIFVLDPSLRAVRVFAPGPVKRRPGSTPTTPGQGTSSLPRTGRYGQPASESAYISTPGQRRIT